MKHLQNILFIGLAGLIMWGVYFIVSKQGEAVGQNETPNKTIVAGDATQAPAPTFDKAALEQAVQSIASRYPTLETGIAVVPIEIDQNASLEGDVPFKAASTTKIIAATYAIKQIENGSETFGTVIGSTSLKDHIERMIVDSDNDAWYAIFDEFGYSAITQFGDTNGSPSFDAAENIITPLDMSRFMSSLHKGDIISAKNVAYLESLMSRSDTGTIALSRDYNSLIRKAGWLEDRQNLTGIITAQDKVVAYTLFAKSKDGETFSPTQGNAFINESLAAITAALK